MLQEAKDEMFDGRDAPACVDEQAKELLELTEQYRAKAAVVLKGIEDNLSDVEWEMPHGGWAGRSMNERRKASASREMGWTVDTSGVVNGLARLRSLMDTVGEAALAMQVSGGEVLDASAREAVYEHEHNNNGGVWEE